MLTQQQITKIKSELSGDRAGFILVFKALGDISRFNVFKLLMKHHDICVTDVANVFNITVSAASQQLRVLERLGLIIKIKMGQMVCYEINLQNLAVKQLVKLIV